jgi:hypothetical protein
MGKSGESPSMLIDYYLGEEGQLMQGQILQAGPLASQHFLLAV